MSELYLRNLAVPFLSQRTNKYVWKRYATRQETINDRLYNIGELLPPGQVSMANRTCNVASLAMVLRYYGYTQVTPYELTRMYYSEEKRKEIKEAQGDKHPYEGEYFAVNALEHWQNLYGIAVGVYGFSCELFPVNKCKMKDIKAAIAGGFPVMVSYAIERKKRDGTANSSGHVAVVRGFTKVNGKSCIILNDPFGSQASGENNLVMGQTIYGGYYQGSENDGGYGDNVVLKEDEFKKQMGKEDVPGAFDDLIINRAMIVRGPLWNFPDGTNIEAGGGIYSKQLQQNAQFPVTNSLLWHDGIHLQFSGQVKSIGAGRLIAVRNKEIENGSCCFLLFRHQVTAKYSGNDSAQLKTFYALYMHVSYIDIPFCARTFFTTGELPEQYNFNWLKQLFTNMLPVLTVIANVDDSKVEGALNEAYKSVKIYRARLEGNCLAVERANGSAVEKAESYHGRRMLLRLLPTDEMLFKDLQNPEKYNDGRFLSKMLDEKNYKKNVQNDGAYIFFHLDGSLACSKIQTVTLPEKPAKDFFQFVGIKNSTAFKNNASKLNKLNKKEVVTFNELTDLSLENNRSLLDYLNNKAHLFTHTIKAKNFDELCSARFIETAQFAYWHKILKKRAKKGEAERLYPMDTICEVLESIRTDFVFLYTSKENVITEKLKKFFGSYASARDSVLRKHLSELTVQNMRKETKNTEVLPDWKLYLASVFSDCFSTMNSLWNLTIPGNSFEYWHAQILDPANTTAQVTQRFIQELKKADLHKLDISYALELVCCALCSIDKNEIQNQEYFSYDIDGKKDICLTVLLQAYTDELQANLQLFLPDFKYYDDTFIETGKNEVIARTDIYNKNEDVIHFEIFSAVEENVYDKLEILKDEQEHIKQFEDRNKNAFLDASAVVAALKTELSKLSLTFEKLDKNIMTNKEFNSIHTKTDLFIKCSCVHTSQWSTSLEYKVLEKQKKGFLNLQPVYKHVADRKRFIYEDINIKEYHSRFIEEYHWFSKEVFGTEKSKFKNDLVRLYHPLFFLETLKKEEGAIA